MTPKSKKEQVRFRFGNFQLGEVIINAAAFYKRPKKNHPGLQVLQGCQAAAILALPSLWYGRVVPLVESVVSFHVGGFHRWRTVGFRWVGERSDGPINFVVSMCCLFTDSTMGFITIKWPPFKENVFIFCPTTEQANLCCSHPKNKGVYKRYNLMSSFQKGSNQHDLE